LAPAPRFAPTTYHTVLEIEGLRLRAVDHGEWREGEPLLLVSSLINRWYVLDLLEGQSFVEMLGTLGRPVYVVEWRPPGGDANDVSLDSLCAGPLRAAVEYVCRVHGVESASIVGYSMGGTLGAMFAARYPARVSRLATLCSPIRFAQGGLFTRWFSPRYLDVDQIASTYPLIPASIVHMPFWWLRPTIKAKKLAQLARGFDKSGYLEYFLATEVWNHDNVDLARGVFRGWAGDLYQRDALVAGQLAVDGEPVDLSRITCPVLAISGADDNIVPWEAAEALLELVSSSVRGALRAQGCHHVGVLTSRRVLAAERDALQAWLDAGPAPRKRGGTS
jgi:polyhydroxyalkanoate synthase